MRANLHSKRTTLNFSAQISSKIDLGLEIEKINVGIRINIIDIIYVPIFSQNRQLSIFRLKFAQKWIWGWKFGKLMLE